MSIDEPTNLTMSVQSPGFSITVIFVLSIIGIIVWLRCNHDKLLRFHSPDIIYKSYNPPRKTKIKKSLKTRRVVIAALVRDVGEKIDNIRKTVENLTKGWLDWRFLVVENDSNDDTRSKLLAWSKQNPRVIVLGCGVNAKKCELGIKRTTGHDIYASRIQKMVYLRNVYIDFIANNNSELQQFDYLLVWDPDLEGFFEPDDTDNTLDYLDSNKSISVACAHGYYPSPIGTGNIYFDTYAHVNIDQSLDDGDLGLIRRNLIKWNSMYWKKSDEPKEVRSCFGGLTAYRIYDIIDKKIKYKLVIGTNAKPLCEHVSFNVQFPGKKVVLPSWPYTIIKNE